MNNDNKRTQILIKAIETNKDLDVDKLAESFRQSRKSPREIFNVRLLRGCIFSLIGMVVIIAGLVNLNSNFVSIYMIIGGILLAVGISYLIVCYMTRKQLSALEEK